MVTAIWLIERWTPGSTDKGITVFYGNNKKWVRSLSYARIFDTEEDARTYLDSLPETRGISSVIGIWDEVGMMIRSQQVRHKMCRRFKMVADTHLLILADRCEDEGMIEEAEILRKRDHIISQRDKTCQSNR